MTSKMLYQFCFLIFFPDASMRHYKMCRGSWLCRIRKIKKKFSTFWSSILTPFNFVTTFVSLSFSCLLSENMTAEWNQYSFECTENSAYISKPSWQRLVFIYSAVILYTCVGVWYVVGVRGTRESCRLWK